MIPVLASTALLFASTFVLVFAFGFQSLSVTGGHPRSAFLASFLVGASQLVLFKLLPDASWIEVAAYLLGGPIGIVASMRVHARLFRPEAPTPE